MSGPTIWFATLAAGGSHVSSAHAMAQAVQAVAPGAFDTPIREPLEDWGMAEWSTAHKASWRWQLAHPWTITVGQPIINAFPRATQWFNRRTFREFARRAAAELEALAPRLVVGNHPFLVTALTMSRREFGLSIPVVHFQTTTLDVTSLWAVPEADRYLCGSPLVRRELAAMGVDPDRVDVVGYPVRQSFLRGPGRDEARVAAGLRDEFTCLLLIGGEGVGLDAQPIVAALREQPFPVQVVVIAGRNEALRSELAERWSSDPLVRVEGFVADIAGLLRAADVVVGKTGPASTFETLAVGRPILAPRRSGTSENRILAFLEARALGAHVPTLASLLERIRGYHERPDTLAEIERRCRAFDFPGMTERVGRYLAAHARDGVPDPSLQGPGIE